MYRLVLALPKFKARDSGRYQCTVFTTEKEKISRIFDIPPTKGNINTVLCM